MIIREEFGKHLLAGIIMKVQLIEFIILLLINFW